MFNLNEEGYACWAGHAAVGGIAATAASWGARRKRPRARGVAFCSRALGASRYAAERRSRSADRFPPVEKFRTTRRILRIAAGQTRQLTCRAIYLAVSHARAHETRRVIEVIEVIRGCVVRACREQSANDLDLSELRSGEELATELPRDLQVRVTFAK